MAGIPQLFLAAITLALSFISVLGQESINAGLDMNVGMHAGIALVMTFGILGSCALGINLMTRYCAKKLTY